MLKQILIAAGVVALMSPTGMAQSAADIAKAENGESCIDCNLFQVDRQSLWRTVYRRELQKCGSKPRHSGGWILRRCKFCRRKPNRCQHLRR